MHFIVGNKNRPRVCYVECGKCQLGFVWVESCCGEALHGTMWVAQACAFCGQIMGSWIVCHHGSGPNDWARVSELVCPSKHTRSPRQPFAREVERGSYRELVESKSFAMNWQQNYRGSSFYVEWMRGKLVCKKNSLSICKPHVSFTPSCTNMCS